MFLDRLKRLISIVIENHALNVLQRLIIKVKLCIPRFRASAIYKEGRVYVCRGYPWMRASSSIRSELATLHTPRPWLAVTSEWLLYLNATNLVTFGCLNEALQKEKKNLTFWSLSLSFAFIIITCQTRSSRQRRNLVYCWVFQMEILRLITMLISQSWVAYQ